MEWHTLSLAKVLLLPSPPHTQTVNLFVFIKKDCGLVVRVPGYSSRGLGSILSAARFSERVGLEQDPFSLVNAIEELLERKSSSSGLENREYGRDTLYPQKLTLTSPPSGDRSVYFALGLRPRTYI
jgi:hypothetical protein